MKKPHTGHRPFLLGALIALIAGCASHETKTSFSSDGLSPAGVQMLEDIEDFERSFPEFDPEKFNKTPMFEVKVKERTIELKPRAVIKQKQLEDTIIANTAGRLDRQALRFAMEARQCAIRANMTTIENDRLTIINYGIPSNQKRLWIVDLDTGAVLLEDWVAHGSGSGGLIAERFSNTPDSHQSSLGLIEPMFQYQASSGPAMRLKGLEKGINDKIYDRAIIVHQAKYVGPGKQGRSQGCQAVRPEALHPFLKGLDGGLMYSYHPTQTAALASKLLACGAVLTAADFSCSAPSINPQGNPTNRVCAPQNDAMLAVKWATTETAIAWTQPPPRWPDYAPETKRMLASR